MSQRVGRLQQENSKLREEIKRLKGALKDINHDIVQEAPILKPRRDRSPLSRERKKVIREEIDSRLNYVIPTSAILKQKTANLPEKEALQDAEDLVASFGKDEENIFLGNTARAVKYDTYETNQLDSSENRPFSNKNSEFSIEIESSIEKTPFSPGFEHVVTKHPMAPEAKTLKESFSSYYNDESMSRVIEERSALEELSEPVMLIKDSFKEEHISPAVVEKSNNAETERLHLQLANKNFSEKRLVYNLT